MNDLRYSLPLEMKASGDAGTIEGYASTFGGPPDWHGDIVVPGAFTETLLEHKAAGTVPAMFWSHDQSEPIGKWLDVQEDEHGLFVRGKLTMQVQRARDAFALAKDGALAFSIGFAPVRKTRSGGANLLESVKLGEISLVGLPSNSRAQITAVKSLAQVDTIREFEQLMRKQHGLSSRQAKRLATGGYYGLCGEDDGADRLAQAILKSAHNFGVKSNGN